MDNRSHPFEAHARIDVLGRQRCERAIRIGVVLDEDVVPDLDAASVRTIDQLGSFGLLLNRGLAGAGAQIDMNFGARTAGAGFAHHPEVVLLAAVDDVDFRIQTDRPELRRPQFPGFLIALSRILLGRIGLINRGIDALRRKLPDLDHQLPGPIDGVLLEVVAEGPIPQHLEKGVVIGV